VLPGGESTFDVLQEALLALLGTPAAAVTTSWEALAVRIAQNKAKDALRRSTRGRRSPKAESGTPDDVTVVSFDENTDVADADMADDPETAFVIAEQQLWLIRQARATLNERQRRIFWTGYYGTQTDKELGAELGISGQAAGQQRRRILRDLHKAALQDPSFPRLDARDDDEGEQT
jgi:RNA polymerase sigma factor (sigma-70 family)